MKKWLVKKLFDEHYIYPVLVVVLGWATLYTIFSQL
jgi:hypothetical protein